ncbi:thermonuclease family protein [Sphingomonas sp. BIUV-7]|uniref:Thermonuclease family protein n=1 Tax=Sphingomonas natans TaxID=3063330 RepID=A0ABT8YAL5_9SPHN|nr:thermonuclease family protein [Sphingomonas sp. BIUV-7]MDO6415382.1 thermonuclease family protein [Sphingomonas sp. BIUV-7]
MIVLFLLAAAALSGPVRVIDGDTRRAGSERIRLLGIDAADNPTNSRCRRFPKPGAICDRARSAEATASLSAAMTPHLTIERVGRDRFGRELAVVWSSKANLSCWQLRGHQASYRRQRDDGRRIARACPDAAR